MGQPNIIEGAKHTDSRGTLSFINEFDMLQIRRFYTIEHPNIEIERGWRGHKIEQRWFSVSKGSFVVKLVRIDNWEFPSPILQQQEFILSEKQHSVLHIPKGYASCLKANEANSKLIVFADSTVENAELDDYLFPIDYFKG